MAEWRWLLYLCGDNDLDPTGNLARNLYQLEKEGPSDDVEVLFQVDGLNEDGGLAGTKRYCLRKTNRLRSDFKVESELVADLGELDTGEERTLVDFLEWGLGDSTARHHMVLLWNHGSGILDIIERTGVQVTSEVRDAGSIIGELSRSFFKRRMIREIVSLGGFNESVLRAIGYDVTSSGDALETIELRRAIENGLAAANHRRGTSGLPPLDKIDLLAFDACFMGSLELAVELHGVANIMVASEASVPAYGYPYGTILRGLKADPGMEPANFARHLTSEFVNSYSSEYWFVKTPVTLSALNLLLIDEVTGALGAFLHGVVEGCKASGTVAKLVCRGVSDDAAKITPRFFQDGKYVDGLIYLEIFFQKGIEVGQPISPIIDSNRASFEQMRRAVLNSGYRIANVSHRRRIRPADPELVTSGFTLLYPPSALAQDLLRNYDDLVFSKSPMGQWRDFLREIKSLA